MITPFKGNGYELWAPAGQICPVCGGVGDVYGDRDGYALRECRGKALLHDPVLLSWQWESLAAYEALYKPSGGYHVQVQQQAHLRTTLERDTEHLKANMWRVALLKQFLPDGGVLLDVGAGAGTFVAVASACGYQAMGLEPSGMHKEASGLGRKVELGDWRDASGLHDAIFLHDVLEHLTQPYQCLYHLSKKLAAGGLLVVEMPEWDCPEARSKQAEFRHVRPMEHIYLTSEGAARQMFTRVNLRVEAIFRPASGANREDRVLFIQNRGRY